MTTLNSKFARHKTGNSTLIKSYLLQKPQKQHCVWIGCDPITPQWRTNIILLRRREKLVNWRTGFGNLEIKSKTLWIGSFKSKTKNQWLQKIIPPPPDTANQGLKSWFQISMKSSSENFFNFNILIYLKMIFCNCLCSPVFTRNTHMIY